MTRLLRGAFITPHGGSAGDAVAFNHEKEMVIHQGAGGLITVHDPLFARPYAIGDKSFFHEDVVGAYLKATIDFFGLHFSTRHLLNVEEREKKVGTGRWSTLQHSIGVAAVSQSLRCSPAQIMYAATHDVAKRIGGHRSDDLLDGRGKEYAHDTARASFLRRSGFIGLLRKRGIIDGRYRIESLGIPIWDVIDPPAGRSIINLPGSYGELEPERIQYPLFERNIWIDTDPVAVQEALPSFRIQKDEYGEEHIVCTREEIAHMLHEAVMRCHSELWGEPGDAIMNELLMAQTRFMLTYKDGTTRDLREYAVGDSLYYPEEEWIKRSRGMETSLGILFNGALEKIFVKYIQHQREVHGEYDNPKNIYSGPLMPPWIRIDYDTSASYGLAQHTRYDESSDTLEIEIMPGKQRFVNPYIDDPSTGRRGLLEHLWDGLSDTRARRYQWSARPFSASIDLNHAELNLTSKERDGLRDGLRYAAEHWAEALRRPPMPDDMLRERIVNWGERVREAAHSAAYLSLHTEQVL